MSVPQKKEVPPEWKTKEWAARVQAEALGKTGLFPNYISVPGERGGDVDHVDRSEDAKVPQTRSA
ncbi:hypothetical protein KBB48_02035 [Candidatus Shapirobacteria bacterium]|nr:hypothetical protein [Candidatus Shapirobacteria bacterium]